MTSRPRRDLDVGMTSDLAPAATDPPIFVVGVARSGTTLLAAMLSSHSRLDCGPESRFFARYRHLDAAQRRRLLDATEWPTPAMELLRSLRNQGHPVTELFGLTEDEVEGYLAARPPALPTVLEALTVLHAQQAGKPRWIEKTPRHLLMTDILRRLWPQARIVRIVRDPRDVALSLAAMPFAKESVVGNLVRIDQDDRASRDTIAADPLAMTLRYEDLVTEPERELRRVCAFVGEAFESSMVDGRRASPQGASADVTGVTDVPGATGVPGVAAPHEWWKQSVSGPLTTNSVGRWRREMAADVQRFAELHLADFMRAHGYEGGREPRGQLVVLPVADGVGRGNEQLLVELARRETEVVRPAPRDGAAILRGPAVLFLGVRGQLDPGRGHAPSRRVLAASVLASGLLWRRLRGRPVPWLRRATLRERRTRDPVELLIALALRLAARQVTLEHAWHEGSPAARDGGSGR
jgi:hypothetical protein